MYDIGKWKQVSPEIRRGRIARLKGQLEKQEAYQSRLRKRIAFWSSPKLGCSKVKVLLRASFGRLLTEMENAEVTVEEAKAEVVAELTRQLECPMELLEHTKIQLEEEEAILKQQLEEE